MNAGRRYDTPPLPNAETPLEELCRRLKDSDRAAFEAVFRRFREDLLRYVSVIVGDDHTAHDLVQDVFVSLWGLRERLVPTKSLRAYLFRMARNRAYRHLRDERAHARKHAEMGAEAQAQPPPAHTVDAQHDADVLTKKLHGWIDALPNRQREALTLSRFHELSHYEIAAVMEISPRTVNNHIVRALEHLKGCIQAFEPSLLES